MSNHDQPATTCEAATVLASFELSQSSWVVTILAPDLGKLSRHTLAAGDPDKALGLLTAARVAAERRLDQPVSIATIFEAGLDGFWLHRWLTARGIDNRVVDAASIAAPRRKRRAKSDGIDGETLVRTLAAWRRGEPRVCSMVQVPSPAEEDRRQLCRERHRLVDERTALSNRIKGLLASQGVRDAQPLKPKARQTLATLRTGDDRPLPPCLRAQIERMLDRLDLVQCQIAVVEAGRDALLAEIAAQADGPKNDPTGDPTGEAAMVRLLLGLRGIGEEVAAMLVLECFYRSFANRRQLASFAGLAPTPWRSGSIQREQGVGKCGHGRLRKLVVQLAWLWSRHQPDTAPSRWFRAMVAQGRGRVRRIAIIGLARRLLVALWRYVTQGVAIEGAVLKPAAA